MRSLYKKSKRNINKLNFNIFLKKNNNIIFENIFYKY